MSESNGADETAQVLAFINTRLARNGPVQDCSANLLLSRVIDSMAMLELVVWIEQTWAVRVRNEDLVSQNFHSVNALADYIRRSRAAVGQPLACWPRWPRPPPAAPTSSP